MSGRGNNTTFNDPPLQRFKLIGGVVPTDPALYYTAVHMTRVIDWCRHAIHKLWVSLEQDSVPFPIVRLHWAGAQISCSHQSHLLLELTLQKLKG